MLIGIVGKPNCGKSTFFKACTLADVAIANYPFTTIKPNHGVGYVKIDCVDKEFKLQCKPRTGYCKDGKRFVPVELMDVAGLVKGASEGRGLGNQFLDDLRQADAFIHIVDISGETDSEGKSIQGYDPCQDVEMLENELDFWYLSILKKVWRTFTRQLQQTKENFEKAVAKQFSGLKINEEDVKAVLSKLKYNVEKPGEWSDEQLKNFVHLLRHETKKMIIAANKCDRPDASQNFKKLKKAYPELIIIPCSADSELALREASNLGLIDYLPGNKEFNILKQVNEKQKQALESIKKILKEYGSTGVQEILNTAVFELLRQIAVFPVENATHVSDSKSNVLPDCFLVPQGSTALDLAYAVHTDFGKNFIKAIDAKTKQVVGKEHKLKNRDVLEIVTR